MIYTNLNPFVFIQTLKSETNLLRPDKDRQTGSQMLLLM